ncbi:MAG: Hsp20/alpha crystallin family protein [Anaerolineae bacterium]|jgi:HSP20 family protein|nr:Hsp20/alpha crystallin family protein [Anaerolineae bacterium]MBT7073136.1 Hsp20/alpha crystallin family protein [Anaerolineae bacterium]MBT7326638.1 Hsp20/alpha crystallin family protein [Anaerolineae bacterium]
MSKIIRKIVKRSDIKKDHHPVKQALGWQMQVRSKVWSPPTDMYEIEDAYIIRMEIAGMREEDFTVSVEGSFLVISGNRPDVQERRAYHQMEIRCGRFSSAVSLPGPVDLENANAAYEDGFFVATLPKLKPNQIAIEEE